MERALRVADWPGAASFALEPIDWSADLTSRGAIAAAASVLYVTVMIGLWWWWTGRLARRRATTPIRVLVTGSRGKSSTIRALHAALDAAGHRAYAKTTGTAAAEIRPDGSEVSTRRLGRPSILEVLRRLDAALRPPNPPDTVLFECMAVQPGLIRQVADEMVDPNVVVITNVQVDHLEDEGSNLTEIAASLAEGIRPGSLVVTGEDAPGPLDAIRSTARERAATLLVVRPSDVPESLRPLIPDVHPQNAAITLAVTRAFGIADSLAVDGMSAASREPGEREVWRRPVGDLDCAYTDLGAINDPQSLAEALDAFPWPGRGVVRIGLVVGRWDRPLRSLSFLGCLRPELFDGLVLVGGPDRRVRRDLVEDGWDPHRVLTAVHRVTAPAAWRRRLTQLARRVDPGAQQVLVVGLENEHDQIADRGREWFHGGERVQLPDAWGGRSPGGATRSGDGSTGGMPS